MYVSGDISSYTSRIHQLPSTVADVDNFITEGNTYIYTNTTIHLSGKWERELRLRKYLLTSNLNYLDTQQLGINYIPTLLTITDVNNSGIMDVNNITLQGWF